jgi:uncharacterized protein (DUF4415 family)
MRRLLSSQRLWSSNQDYRVRIEPSLLSNQLLALFEKWVPARLRSDESYASVYTYSPLRAANGACMHKATKNRKAKQMSGRALTTRQKRELAALAALPDDQIDTSDIPELPPGAWKNAVRGRFYRPIKQAVSMRLDADVIAWLKKRGKGYQTRVNSILRQTMLADTKRAWTVGSAVFMKTRKPRKPIPAEAIARNADQGSDVSRFFTNTGRMRQSIPVPSAPEKPRRSSFSARANLKPPQ